MPVLIDSPVGPLGFSVADGAVTKLDWGHPGNLSEGPLAELLRTELGEYFAGKRTEFSVPVNAGGSQFQRRFYDALCAIPYGETRTYGDLAKDLDAPAQAIGQACGGNPIAILIPCHRVLGADSLGGYSGVGGIETKVALLKLEGAAGLLI